MPLCEFLSLMLLLGGRRNRKTGEQKKKPPPPPPPSLLFLPSPYLVGPVTMQVSPSMGPPTSSMGGTERRRRRCGVAFCFCFFWKEREREAGLRRRREVGVDRRSEKTADVSAFPLSPFFLSLLVSKSPAYLSQHLDADREVVDEGLDHGGVESECSSVRPFFFDFGAEKFEFVPTRGGGGKSFHS
jgi:hypothetical protein